MADILVISSEQLRSNRSDVMERVFRFIGVAPHVAHGEEKFASEGHVSSEKARKNDVAAFLTETAVGRMVKEAGKRLVPEKTIEWAKGTLWTDTEKPTLAEDVQARVQDYLHEDVEKLRDAYGQGVSGLVGMRCGRTKANGYPTEWSCLLSRCSFRPTVARRCWNAPCRR